MNVLALLLTAVLSPQVTPPTPADLVAVRTRTAIAIALATTNLPPKNAEPITPGVIVRIPVTSSPLTQRYAQSVRHGYSRPVFYDFEGIDNPTHSFAVSHIRRAHSSYLPVHVNIAELDIQQLKDIHSLIHNIENGQMAPRPLGVWSSVCPADGTICVHTWTWHLP